LEIAASTECAVLMVLLSITVSVYRHRQFDQLLLSCHSAVGSMSSVTHIVANIGNTVLVVRFDSPHLIASLAIVGNWTVATDV
jgi:TRAP-type C4-dicarboxylate transport system permease large subunit